MIIHKCDVAMKSNNLLGQLPVFEPVDRMNKTANIYGVTWLQAGKNLAYKNIINNYIWTRLATHWLCLQMHLAIADYL